jgi:hypothetical protein
MSDKDVLQDNKCWARPSLKVPAGNPGQIWEGAASTLWLEN